MHEDFQAAMRERERLAGSWVGIGHPTAVEVTAAVDPDFLVLDLEHWPTSLESLHACIAAADGAGANGTVVRVPANEPWWFKRVLDLGADGVMVPMVDTPEAAERAVRNMRHPPAGVRGVASTRATDYGEHTSEYLARANDDLLTVVQVESETAVGNAEAIGAVEGVDAMFVGPTDLSWSLDVFGDFDAPEFQAAVDEVLVAGEATDTAVGTLATGPETTRRWVERGYDFVVTGVDFYHVKEGVRSSLAAFEDAL